MINPKVANQVSSVGAARAVTGLAENLPGFERSTSSSLDPVPTAIARQVRRVHILRFSTPFRVDPLLPVAVSEIILGSPPDLWPFSCC